MPLLVETARDCADWPPMLVTVADKLGMLEFEPLPKASEVGLSESWAGAGACGARGAGAAGGVHAAAMIAMVIAANPSPPRTRALRRIRVPSFAPGRNAWHASRIGR
jgi:hypothetical protein